MARRLARGFEAKSPLIYRGESSEFYMLEGEDGYWRERMAQMSSLRQATIIGMPDIGGWITWQ